jgi:GNAT superfamily N-acetyltransferase
MSITFHENYWDSPGKKSQFIAFLKLIHGVDLSAWDKLGFWDKLYRPFSYFDGDTLVSNVCVYSMNMTVNGQSRLAAQISAVGTLPDYRRQGLSYELTQKALDWARDNHDFFYLFADDEALGFYRKCGFRPVGESKTRISVTGQVAKPGAFKLDINREDHLATICRIASGRVPVSDVLGVSNVKLLMFWLLNLLKEHIYHIPELDILVLYKHASGRTTIFDVVGERVPPFSAILPYIGSENDRTIEFLFMTDKLELRDTTQVKIEDNGTHIMGEFPLESSRFIIPFTAQA